VTDEERMALIHAELDGDLGSEQRTDLARMLLADPQMRALRDELQGICNRLGALGEAEPPLQLKDSLLNCLPPVPLAVVTPLYRSASFGRWRLAALFAGLLTAGTIVYETVQGPSPAGRETAGTMAADAFTTVDSVVLAPGPVTGRAILYRDKSRLAVGLEVATVEPVDVLIATGEHSFRINGLGGSSATGNTQRMVALADVGMQGQDVEVSFLIGGRTVTRATLHAPPGP
jgi:hypothetical protein